MLRAFHGLGVCPSVCLSVTLLYCIKTVRYKITKSSQWVALKTLVYSDEISCPSVRGVSLEQGRQKEVPSIRRYFDAIGSFTVKTVTDKYRLN